MTKFKKGHDPRRNIKGRPPNKTTEQIRELVKEFVSDNIFDLQACFDTLEAKEKLIFFEKLLKHILPAPLDDLQRLTDEQLNEIIQKLKRNEL